MTILGVLSAFWLGILASVSPCPLASNIAAFSYIEKDCSDPRRVIVSGAFYSLGRMITFAVLGALVIRGVLQAHNVSFFLQKQMNILVGPVLLILAVFLLDLLELPPFKFASRLREKGRRFSGAPGAFLMGCLFALALCPVSAALFFGGLIPLAVSSGSAAILPAVFGLGTALPVAVAAAVVSLGARSLARWFDRLSLLQSIVTPLTGVLLLLTGLYFTLSYTLNLW